MEILIKISLIIPSLTTTKIFLKLTKVLKLTLRGMSCILKIGGLFWMIWIFPYRKRRSGELSLSDEYPRSNGFPIILF